MERIHGADVWKLTSDLVTLDVTVTGGMSTAEFRLGDRSVRPYSLSPWEPGEVDEDLPQLLKVLRGDFFCLPFGPQDQGDPHGATANALWTEVEVGPHKLHLKMECEDSGASVSKVITIGVDHPAVYQEHRISGLSGKWSYGNHPILDCSTLAEGSARVSVSPFRWGSVYQGVFSNPDAGERQCLKDGATFDSLEAVDLATGARYSLNAAQCGFGYRDSVFKHPAPDGPGSLAGADGAPRAGFGLRDRVVITQVRLFLPKPWKPVLGYADLGRKMVDTGITEPDARQIFDWVCAIRSAKLPNPELLGNAGSFFKNPSVTKEQCDDIIQREPRIVHYPMANGGVKLAAGWLIDACGWKGKTIGRAGVYEKQALVLVNRGGATGAEVVTLAKAIQESVYGRFGIRLEPEPMIV